MKSFRGLDFPLLRVKSFHTAGDPGTPRFGGGAPEPQRWAGVSPRSLLLHFIFWDSTY